MLKFLSASLTGVMLSAAPALACSPQDKQFFKMVTTDFCTFLNGDRKPATDLFTPSLLAEIKKAETADAAWAKAHKGDKPPLGDGIPYQAYPDHAPGCAPGTNLHVDHKLHMEVKYDFPAEPKANWTDHLVLIKTDGGAWKIDDILYAPDYKMGLRMILTDVASGTVE